MAGPRKRRSAKKAAAKRPSVARGKRGSAAGTQDPLAIPPSTESASQPAEVTKARAGRRRGGKKAAKSATDSAAARASASGSAADAQFVFRGIVQERGVATFDEVPLTANTLVVGVEEILRSPDLLRDFEHSAITVQLGEGQEVDVGEHYVFYTNGWIYGAGLAVESVAVTSDTEAEHSSARAAFEKAPTNAIQARASEADLVVTGQVTQVTQAPKPPRAPITEHDPHWQDAVVTVDSVLQGAATSARQPKEVVVRFAASRDVRWAMAPKFGVGQAGIWMLGHKDKTQRNAMRAVADVSDDEYVVIDPNDFHPIDAIDHVKSLLAQDNTGDTP